MEKEIWIGLAGSLLYELFDSIILQCYYGISKRGWKHFSIALATISTESQVFA